MCDCDCDGPKVFDYCERTARKPYKCAECGREIAKGERYERISGLWDGGWSTFRWCSHCSAGVKILDDMLDCFCFNYTEVWWDIEDAVNYEPAAVKIAALRLKAGSRRGWRHRRGPNAGRLMPIPAVPARA